MPEGLLLLHFNTRSGIEILDKYPKEIASRVSKKTLLQVYNMHQYARQKGTAWLNLESINFISYYSGPSSNYFVVLILNILEDPEDFEKEIELIAQKVLNNLDSGQENGYLPIAALKELELA
ncbi:MAG: hypothetical protein GF311_04515 [Candidatus Lokiarchaeota archaeon]|nr:hypothetical protein [Candidatus Lokiarchaeota archaeon]